MDEEILKEYEKVKEFISEEEFIEKVNIIKSNNEEIGFMGDVDAARMVVGEFKTEENETISEKKEHAMDKINKLEAGANNVNLVGRVMKISNPKTFISKQGKKGELCNLEVTDETGSIRVVLWTRNIKLLKKFNEGDVIKIGKVDVRKGYNENIEAHLTPRSTIKVLDKDLYSYIPEYKEDISSIEDVIPDTKVNIIARILRIPNTRSFEKNGKKGKVASLELQDATGKISYTLWNNDVDLIDELELTEGDSIKILSAEVRERNDEISLSHWDSRIVKGDFDVPDYEEDIIKIAEAHEQKDISLLGLVSKVFDPIIFTRDDDSEGKVQSIEIRDETGSIRVTLWGDDTSLSINKGDILKVIGGNIEFDEYSPSGYRVNTNWNTSLNINPEEPSDLIDLLKEFKSEIGPIKIEEVQNIDDDGQEVDIIGRIISVGEINEFSRDDGTTGCVRSLNFADESGFLRLSLWDEKSKENFKVGDAYKVENARTKLGIYSMDLNIGKTSRMIKLTDEEATFLPTLESLIEMIYDTKEIVDLDEEDINIRVVGRIIEVYDIREFERDENNKGSVRNIEIADNSGSITVTLWDSNANIIFEIGEPIKFENPRVVYREDHLELSVGNNTIISSPNEKELGFLPSFEEIKEIVYKVKTIEALEDNDTNVHIKGVFKDVVANRILLSKCPHCNNNIEDTGDDLVCDFCGNEVDTPKYVLMIPGRLEDDTGEIPITFFGNLAEELIEMNMDEIVDIIGDTGDIGVLEGKIEDLNGLNIDIIANVSFDEFNEEIRLRPKKILSKTY